MTDIMQEFTAALLKRMVSCCHICLRRGTVLIQCLCSALQVADKQRAGPTTESRTTEKPEASGAATALEEVVLQNGNQFYRWHTELEAAQMIEREEKYRRYADTLSGHLASCDSLLEKASAFWPLIIQFLEQQHCHPHSSRTAGLLSPPPQESLIQSHVVEHLTRDLMLWNTAEPHPQCRRRPPCSFLTP